jgi:hypothetical protein
VQGALGVLGAHSSVAKHHHKTFLDICYNEDDATIGDDEVVLQDVQRI